MSWTGTGIPAVGDVGNLDVRVLDFGVVAVGFVAVAAAVRWAVYVDSLLRTVTSGSPAVLAGIAEGTHDFAVVALEADEAAPAIRPEWATGDQALVTWARVDTAHGYRVTLETQEALVTERAADLGIRTGALGGRVRFAGTVSDLAPPDTITVTVETGGRTVAWSSTTTDGGHGILGKGLIVGLPYGLTAEFLDAPALYQVAESFSVDVGPVTRWLSGAVGRGTAEGAVSAVDAMGIEGDPAAVEVYVPAPDAEVVEWVTAWDEDTLVTEWTIAGAHATGIRVFSNLPSVGGLLAAVDEMAVVHSATGLTGSLSWPRITDAWAGELQVIVEIATSTGQWVREGVVRRLSLPVDAPALGTAEVAEAAQSGLGVDAVAVYRAVESDVMTAVRIAYALNGGTATTVDVATARPLPGFGVRVPLRIAVAGATDGDVVSVTARGVGAGGLLGAVSAAVEVELVVTDPDAPATAAGTPA